MCALLVPFYMHVEVGGQLVRVGFLFPSPVGPLNSDCQTWWQNEANEVDGRCLSDLRSCHRAGLLRLCPPHDPISSGQF